MKPGEHSQEPPSKLKRRCGKRWNERGMHAWRSSFMKVLLHACIPFGIQRRGAVSGVCGHDVGGGQQWGRKRMETSFDLSAVTNGKRYCYCNCVQDTHTDAQSSFWEDVHWHDAFPRTPQVQPVTTWERLNLTMNSLKIWVKLLQKKIDKVFFFPPGCDKRRSCWLPLHPAALRLPRPLTSARASLELCLAAFASFSAASTLAFMLL